MSLARAECGPFRVGCESVHRQTTLAKHIGLLPCLWFGVDEPVNANEHEID
jgi:hypothetical protein